MADDIMVELLQRMFYVSLQLIVPPLGIALVVGLLIGLLQAITSIQEQTLSFVPKIVAVAMVLVFLGSWMLRILIDYTADLFNRNCLRSVPCDNHELTQFFDWAAPFILGANALCGLLIAGPVLGADFAPVRVRAGVSLLLALLIFPPTDSMQPGIAGPTFVAALSLELLVGVFIGWCAMFSLRASLWR